MLRCFLLFSLSRNFDQKSRIRETLNLSTCADISTNTKYPKNTTTKNPAYGQHWTLSYMWDSGVLILYHESKSIPWVLSVPLVHINNMSPCQYQGSMSIPWVLANNMSQCLYHKSINSNYRNTNHKLQKNWITNYRNRIIIIAEIQITGIQKKERKKKIPKYKL